VNRFGIRRVLRRGTAAAGHCSDSRSDPDVNGDRRARPFARVVKFVPDVYATGDPNRYSTVVEADTVIPGAARRTPPTGGRGGTDARPDRSIRLTAAPATRDGLRSPLAVR
jgi:hypothetical protein